MSLRDEDGDLTCCSFLPFTCLELRFIAGNIEKWIFKQLLWEAVPFLASVICWKSPGNYHFPISPIIGFIGLRILLMLMRPCSVSDCVETAPRGESWRYCLVSVGWDNVRSGWINNGIVWRHYSLPGLLECNISRRDTSLSSPDIFFVFSIRRSVLQSGFQSYRESNRVYLVFHKH